MTEDENGMKEVIRKVYIRKNGEWVENPDLVGIVGLGNDGEIIYSYVTTKRYTEQKLK